ncbi:transcription termination factor 3, mitochondrial [Polistes fuscatus]|uniref:transcription termination factor 3, mitochondrial n=1 Tax=Polistes fuscatus TaxID=30207 RepID=UPI001CA7BA67|nr:transcription termination factor 3, mitochondrial [Polistes fuscatus]
MWSIRCYVSLSNAKQINVITNIFKKQFLSKNRNVNNSINPNAHSPTIESKPEGRGYVEKAWNLENKVIPVQNLQETQSNSSDWIQRTITNVDDLSIYDEYIKLPKALDFCNEDISHIGNYQLPSYNIAKYANSSETIQRLIKLGVKLYKHETNVELMEFLLSKDFDKDLFPYIRFLHDCGVPGDYLGEFFTRNPYLFKVDMDDLHTRIRYLRFHQFDINMIKTIICINPKWLNFSTKIIDTRLAYFQTTFHLNGKEVRQLTTKNSKLITYKMSHIRENTFIVKELMGFNQYEMKAILLNQPKIWMKCKKNIISTFDYAHNEMKLSHEFISSQPHVLLCRKHRLEQRHKFLVKLGRAQYDPTKPMYVSLIALISGTNDQFCQNVAKTSTETYDSFLKSIM